MSYEFLIFVAIALVLSLLYRQLGIRALSSLRRRCDMLIPVEQLKELSDYRQFFAFLNKFSKDKLGKDLSGLKKISECSKVGPYHFIMAFSNLIEIQRDRFANNPHLLQELIPIFSEYNNAVWSNDEAGIANTLANYHRKIKGENAIRERSFYITPNFVGLLTKVKDALSNYNLFKAHILLQKKESDISLTDLELLVLNYLLARLSTHFQGRGYKYSKELHVRQIDKIFEEVNFFLMNVKDHPEHILCKIPGNLFDSYA
jgi:hypothetical protein